MIVVWRLDRFARTMIKALLALQEILDDGGQVASHSEQMLDTSDPMGRGIAALLFAIAEAGLDKIRSNWRNAAEEAVAKGWYMGARPLGYDKQPRQPLRPHPTEADAVRGLFARAATGDSYERLRRWLRDTHGIDITVPSLGQLLRSRVYLGELHWGSSARGDRQPQACARADREHERAPAAGRRDRVAARAAHRAQVRARAREERSRAC